MAKAYKAACTPEFYVFDAGLQLRYHGQFDDSRPRGPNNNLPVTGAPGAGGEGRVVHINFGQRQRHAVD